MSENWPALAYGGAGDGIPSERHRHDAGDISGTFSQDIVAAGDIRSANWDGGSDLSSGQDTGATEGYFLDSSAGAAQFKTLYWSLGSSAPLASAGTWSAEGNWPITSVQAEVCSISITDLPANATMLVDMTATIEAKGVATGEWWVAQLGVENTGRGIAIRQAAPSAGSVTVSGSAAASGTGSTGAASADHTHIWSDTSSNASTDHAHGAGTLSAASDGGGYTGYESSHTHSGPSHQHNTSSSTDYANPDYHRHGLSLFITTFAGSGSTGAGSSHRHSTSDHTHSVSGTSNTGGQFHTHEVSGTTLGQSAGHTHSGPSHSHTVTASGSHSHALAYSSTTLRWVGTVDSGVGTLDLEIQAGTQSTAATIGRVQLAYMIWIAEPPRPPAGYPAAASLSLVAPQATVVIS